MAANECIEWAGCVLSLVGAFLLALNISVSRWGWVLYTLASAFFLVLAYRIERYGLLTQNLGFMLTNFLGLYRNGFLRLTVTRTISKDREQAAAPLRS